MNSEAYSTCFVKSEAQIDPSLWDACFPPPREGRWFYKAQEGCGITDQFTFLYAVICKGPQPVGIAPVFMMDVPIDLVVPEEWRPLVTAMGRIFPSLRYQRTLFVGAPCAEEGNVGLLPEADRRSALLCLQRALKKQARDMNATMLTWKDFPASYSDDLGWLGHLSGLFPLISFPGTVVTLTSARKEDYFAALTVKRRHNLKKKLRRSEVSVAVRIQVIQHPDDHTLDEIFHLFSQTYEKAKTRFEKLNRRFFGLMAEADPSYFIILREKSSDEMIAFMLCFDVGGRIINKFIGIDYRRPSEWFLYFRLWDAAVEWALSRNASSIWSGQTGYTAKIEIGHALIPLTNYCQHRNWLIHRLFSFIAPMLGWHTLDDQLARFLKAHPEARPGR